MQSGLDCVISLYITDYNASFVIYLPFRNVIAYDGDTNIPLYVVVAGIGNTQLNFRIPPNIITRLTASNAGTNPVQGILDGPVRVSDTGTPIVCMDGNMYSQTVTLTVLGKSCHFFYSWYIKSIPSHPQPLLL